VVRDDLEGMMAACGASKNPGPHWELLTRTCFSNEVFQGTVSFRCQRKQRAEMKAKNGS